MSRCSSETEPFQPKTIVYIDGFNLFYGALKGTPYKWLDLERLCKEMLPRDEIVKIRYFTARIRARSGDRRRANQQTYLRAVATGPLVETHFGYFRTRRVRMPLADPRAGEPRTVEVLKTEEKGSDVNLATHLLLDAFKGDCNTAVIVSNDSDLAEAIRVTQSQLGVKVGIINPHPRSRRPRALRELGCLFYRQVPHGALAQAQLPPVLRDGEGRIRKPSGW